MIRLDAVLPVLHGKLGEDGAIQACSSCRAFPTRAATSRAPRCAWTSPWLTSWPPTRASPRRNTGCSRGTRRSTPTASPIPSSSSRPVRLVLRRQQGSGRDELPSAIESARQYDAKVLIEEAVVGSEWAAPSSGNDSDWSQARWTGLPSRTASSGSIRRAIRKRLRELRVRRAGRHLGRGALAGPGDGEGHLPRSGLHRARAGDTFSPTTERSCSTRSTPCPA